MLEEPQSKVEPRGAIRADALPVWALPAVVALVLGFVGITDYSLWMDEVITLRMADRSLFDLLRTLRNQDALAGAYYLVMHAWVRVAGTSELALRTPSAIGIAAAAGFTAVIGKRLFSPLVGLTAGLLLAITPRITAVHARDARHYGVLLAAVCASSLAVVIVSTGASRRRWLGYGASVVVVGLLHVLAVPVLASHGALVWMRGGRQAVRRWSMVVVPALVPALLLLVLARVQGGYPTWGDVPDVSRVLAGPTEVLGSPAFGWFLLGLAVAALAASAERVFLGLWLIVPVAALYVASHLANPSWTPRYLLVTVPPLVLLAARSMTTSRIAAVAGAILVIGLVWHPTAELRALTTRNQDYRAAAAFLEAQQSPGDAIVFDHPAHREGIDYYWTAAGRPADPLLDVPAVERARTHPSEIHPVEEASLDGIDRVWILAGRPPQRQAEFVSWLADAGFEIGPRQEFPGLTLTLATR